MMETAQVTSGLSKSPCRHKETWWWKEEIAEVVREKKKSMEIGKKTTQQRHGNSTRTVDKTQREKETEQTV